MSITNIKYEKHLWGQGISVVAGVDEVGRGCFAGPLVAAAVAWNPIIAKPDNQLGLKEQGLLESITDSKKLSAEKRLILAGFIKQFAMAYYICEISSKQIDEGGVGQANKKALRTAAIKIPQVQHVLVDHFSVMKKGDDIAETSITGGDSKSISIAAASIIAKVYRDELMQTKYHAIYPQYGFNSNVGYGTKAHREAIAQYGITPIHRSSFRML